MEGSDGDAIDGPHSQRSFRQEHASDLRSFLFLTQSLKFINATRELAAICGEVSYRDDGKLGSSATLRDGFIPSAGKLFAIGGVSCIVTILAQTSACP
jgi:hypothetical protein